MNRIKELREARGVSMRKVASDLKMPYTTYVNYEKGAREPNSETLIALADYYDTSIDYMLGKPRSSLPIEPVTVPASGEQDVDPSVAPSPSSLSSDEMQLLADYRSLTPPGKEYIRQTMAMAKNSYGEKNGALPDVEVAD